MIAKEVFMDIIAMHRNGYRIGKIAKRHGIHRGTVKRHLENNSLKTIWTRMTIRRPGSTPV